MLLPREETWRAGLGESSGAWHAKILLIGWEGTLAPVSAGSQPTPPPDLVVDLVAPLASEACDAVAAGMERAGFPGSAGTLLAADLRRRLCALYALPWALRRIEPLSPERRVVDDLARGLAADWEAGMRLFLERLRADRQRIAAWMGAGSLPTIRALRPTASDVHGPAGGVIELGFEDGRRIFYKPRPVTGELLWAELVTAVRDAGGPAVATARVLPGCDSPGARYGWMGALPPGVCEEREHWGRAGALLCLAQYAGLSDLHMGNVMATREGPAVLDAECLADPFSTPDANGEATERAMLATGLLPDRRGGSSLPDVSGLFGAGAEIGGVLVPVWGTTEVGGASVAFERARLLEHANRSAVHRLSLTCMPEMVEGYMNAARALHSIRGDLLGAGGWVDRLNRFHEPRVVLRDTLQYGFVMSQSLSPEAIRVTSRALRRALLGEASRRAVSDEVLETEMAALLRLHVPRFYIAAGTCDLAGEDGRVLARDVADSTPADGVRRRLEAMRAGELECDVKSALAAILFRARGL